MLAVAAQEFESLTALGAHECDGDAVEWIDLVRSADEADTRKLVDLLAGVLSGAS
jgi:hypothetical protein